MSSSFNTLDVVVVVLILYSIVQGIFRGVTRQIISLGALVVGLFLAGWYYQKAATLLLPYVRHWELAAFLGFIAIFIAVKLVGAAVGFVVGKLVSAADLKWFDRVIGGAFGFVKGFLLSSVLFLGLLAFPFQLKWVNNAATAPYLIDGAKFIAAVTPPEVKARFEEGIDRLRKIWQNSSKI
ncbi:MAG: CvpA family protein [Acidobacteriia bacterium]|nr:CvpA family protein [Terriglobia bacterium]